MIGVALVVVLWEAGAAAGELFAGSAVLTAVLGFALRDTLGNVVAGLAIHAEHPFDVDDWIQYDTNAAHVGKIVEMVNNEDFGQLFISDTHPERTEAIIKSTHQSYKIFNL